MSAIDQIRLIVYFVDRAVFVSLVKGDQLGITKRTENAAKDLIVMIRSLLEENLLTLNLVGEIGFLSGPSSFTTTRIVTATCLGLSLGRKTKVYQLELEDVIHSIEKYSKKPILTRINQNLFYLYEDNQWKLMDHIPEDLDYIIYDHYLDISQGLINLLNKINKVQAN
jgi:tRNA A37 threonylcarbamoyladenosine modification protein TsaB